MPITKERLWWLIPTIGIGVGILGIGMGSVSLYQSIDRKNWPHTDGITGNVTIVKESRRRYHVEVPYTYKVNGVSHSGTRVAVGLSFRSKELAQDFANRYPPNKQVPVFYSPTHPEDALLERGVFNETWTQIGVGSCFLVLGTVLMIVFGKAKKKTA